MPEIAEFPRYFRTYEWNAKHALFGYPADRYGSFEWICSLEGRFGWLRENCSTEGTAAIFLLREMIHWGGGQNGTLQKFEDGLGEVNLQHLIQNTIANLQDTEKAIDAALQIPGMGLTYASKLLRFLDPERYGALDRRLRTALSSYLPTIYDSASASMVAGYVAFTSYLERTKAQLNTNAIQRPHCTLPVGAGPSQWRSADLEMALFGWASGEGARA